MYVFLNPEEYEVLLSVCEGQPLPEPIRASVRKIQLDLTPDLADRVRDMCGDELAVSGFDENYNLTPRGRILETLVDKLFIG